MNIPKELKEITQWVCWRLVPDNAGGKDRKLPFNPETGKAAASNKPETWTTFENASKAVDRYSIRISNTWLPSALRVLCCWR